MTIVFVINNFKAKVIQFPIGELNTATLLKMSGHDVTIIDTRVETLKKYKNILARADLILISTCTYDFIQCYTMGMLSLTRATITRLRKYGNAKIYVIGPHGTVLPEPTLELTKADGVIQGEFETGIIEFINGKELNKSKTVFRPKQPTFSSHDLSNLKADYSLIQPERYYSNIIRYGKLIKGGKCALIYGNRGCPFKCDFCYNFFGKFRTRNPAVVMQEIEELYSCYGFKDFFFLDYTFTANIKWVSELCERIIESGMKIRWICQTRCDQIDRKTLKQMKRAGCSCIWYGVENPFRPNYKTKRSKFVNRRVANKAITETRRAGIVPVLFLQLMQPQEKLSDVQKFVEWITSIKTYFVVNPFFPLPETPFFKQLTSGVKCDRNWTDMDKAIERNIESLEAVDSYIEIFDKLRKSKWCLSYLWDHATGQRI